MFDEKECPACGEVVTAEEIYDNDGKCPYCDNEDGLELDYEGETSSTFEVERYVMIDDVQYKINRCEKCPLFYEGNCEQDPLCFHPKFNDGEGHLRPHEYNCPLREIDDEKQ